MRWGKVKVKVKCTLVQALRLCTGRTAYSGSGGIALLFHDHGTRKGWEVSVTPRPLFTPAKDPVLIVQEAGWAPGPVWTGAENLAPHRDSIPRPSSLYPVAIPTELPGPQSESIEVSKFIHFAFSFVTGPYILPKRGFHRARSSVCYYNFQYPLLSSRPSSSGLRLLRRLPVTSSLWSIFYSVMCFRRQFLPRMW
jgi:hypothetical protein